MRFSLETSKLLYEVRYQSLTTDEGYTFEQLYQDIDGRYFIHFIGGKYSEYAVKTAYNDYAGREGNYFIDNCEISSWKSVSNELVRQHPRIYSVIDWEEERNQVWMEQIAEEELPF